MYGSSATAGSQYDYVHDNEDSNFQLVDSSKPQKQQKPFRRQFQFVGGNCAYYNVMIRLEVILEEVDAEGP